MLRITHVNYRSEDIKLNISSDTSIVIFPLEKNILMNEVIVTSGKYEQNIDALPYSASIVPEEEIRGVPSASVPELLQYEPGITIVRDGIWGADASIRGLSRSNIVTLVDGDTVSVTLMLAGEPATAFPPASVPVIRIVAGYVLAANPLMFALTVRF